MSELKKRATIYFDPEIHRALKIKAAVSNKSISDFIDEAVRHSLAEDEQDLREFDKRENEPSVSFEQVLGELKANGKI